ncbi:hypothetical protein [Candidatus Halobonum tyrrellensis]|uniref:Uncharacterized protein n=1 Tax=Candidatus Halobonum tyrrellensis G22 TaxID=1324957 RepID=V4HJ21_9EURY|nr:hypothetical protein [Candidatus Halobonum tyrrellensis]ESP87909.1 hypothetical protein K933_11351 [Candidatus Halobonum tyrrellensis G22]
MVSRTTLAVALFAFLGGVAVGGVGAGAALSLDDPFASQPVDEARLASFERASVGCVDPASPDRLPDSSASGPNGSGTDLTLRQNLTVAEPGATLSGDVDEVAPGTYALRMRTEGGDANATVCPDGRTETRFVANLTFPDEEYTLLLFHDGEYVGSNYASRSSGLLSGGASGGGSVSGGASGAAGGSASTESDGETPANATASDAPP